MNNSRNLIIIVVIVILLMVAAGIWLGLSKDTELESRIFDPASALRQGDLPDNIKVSHYEHVVFNFTFSPPLASLKADSNLLNSLSASWRFVDVGLPTYQSTNNEEVTVVETTNNDEFTIYLELGDKLEPDLVMDLEITANFDDDDLPNTPYEKSITVNNYTAQIHTGDCSVNDEPWLYIEDDNNNSLYVLIEELCGADNQAQLDMKSLLIDISNNIRFAL